MGGQTTDRQTGTQRQTDDETDRQVCRQTDGLTDKHMGGQTDRAWTDRRVKRQTQTSLQADR